MSRPSEPRVASWAVTAGIAMLGVPVALIAQAAPAPVAGVAGVALAAVLAWRVFREPEHGVYALVALLPLTDLGVVWPGSGIRLTYVVLPAAVAGWALARYRGAEPRPKAHPLLWALLAPAAAGLATAPFSLDPARSVLYSGRLLALWAVAAFVVTQVRTPERLRRALAVLLAVGVVLSAVALMQVALPGAGLGRVHVPNVGDPLGHIRPSALYMDPNFLGGLLSACVLTGAAFASAARDRRAALRWGLSGLACGLGMALTLSRSAWAGLAVGAVVLVAMAPRRLRLALGGGLAVVALVFVIAVPGTMARLTSGADRSVMARVALVRGELAIALERPLTGTGLASLGEAYALAGGAAETGRVVNPHQVPLAVIAETGVPGAAALVAVLAALASAATARRRRGWEVGDTAVAVVIAAMLVQSLFQYYAYFEPLWLMLALAAASPMREDAVAA